MRIRSLDICALPRRNHLTGIAVQALATAKIWATAGVELIAAFCWQTTGYDLVSATESKLV
jgi:hypothetical protein